ncbi:hypothetical protein HDV00_012738 [Rhizophlyctis rosea]|nr:hypothetical protein HDV00_012738 [Rhizophlyctis rosea]
MEPIAFLTHKLKQIAISAAPPAAPPAAVTIPDILILFFSHQQITVPDLLRSEQVCKQWCAVIRQEHVHIWKPKLFGFPEGYCPALYGSESWRDLVSLWWAWRRPWVPQKTEPDVLKEIGVGKTLMRKGGGFVRDVADAYTFSGSCFNVHGVRPDGQVVVRDRRVTTHCAKIVHAFLETGISARPIHDVALFDHRHTSTIVRMTAHRDTGAGSDGRTVSEDYVFEDWETGTAIATKTKHKLILWDVPRGAIRGSDVILKSVGMFRESITLKRFNVSSADDDHHEPNLRASPAYSNANLYSFNDSFTASIIAPYIISLIPADNTKPMTYKLSLTPTSIHLNRLNLFVFCRTECLVFDLCLTFLYTLPTPDAPIATVSPLTNEIGDQMMFWHEVFENMPKSKKVAFIAGIALLDPRTRTKQYVHPEEYVPNRKLRRGSSRLTRKARKQKEWNAVYLMVVEYPVDGGGKRTGAAGVNRVYRRWIM